MRPHTWLGESLRWYLMRARHPFKNYIVGHYWSWFERPRVWVRYDGRAIIGVRLGDYLQQRIFFDGYYERPLVDWLKATLRPADVFWDVGANIGAITIVAARLCRRVIAFEPDPRSLIALRENLQANRIDNVEVVASALGSQPGTAILYQAAPLNTGMTSLIPSRGEFVSQAEVPLMRADDLIAVRPELTPTVVKLDVEGAEHLVLGGAAALLRSGKVRALVFEDKRGADTLPTNLELTARLREAHFDIQPFAASDLSAADEMYNFVATPASETSA